MARTALMGLRPWAFNPMRNLVYIPTIDLPATFTDHGLDLKALETQRLRS